MFYESDSTTSIFKPFLFGSGDINLQKIFVIILNHIILQCKGKGHAHNRPQGPKGVPRRLRARIFLTFGTIRVVGCQSHSPAAFTPRRNSWYLFLKADSTPGHMVPSVATEKIPSVTPPGIDPEIVRLVEQCLNHYATPGPYMFVYTHVYLYMFVYTHVYLNMCVYTNVYLYMFVYTHLYLNMFVYTHVYRYCWYTRSVYQCITRKEIKKTNTIKYSIS
jgi:hypothetical protein